MSQLNRLDVIPNGTRIGPPHEVFERLPRDLDHHRLQIAEAFARILILLAGRELNGERLAIISPVREPGRVIENVPRRDEVQPWIGKIRLDVYFVNGVSRFITPFSHSFATAYAKTGFVLEHAAKTGVGIDRLVRAGVFHSESSSPGELAIANDRNRHAGHLRVLEPLGNRRLPRGDHARRPAT